MTQNRTIKCRKCGSKKFTRLSKDVVEIENKKVGFLDHIVGGLKNMVHGKMDRYFCLKCHREFHFPPENKKNEPITVSLIDKIKILGDFLREVETEDREFYEKTLKELKEVIK